jgi:hypothetical protein
MTDQNYTYYRKVFLLCCHLLVALSCLCQRDSVVSNLRFGQEQNVAYSQLYILNSDIGDISFFDQGHPDGRQYILNGNIVPNFYVTPRKWPFVLVLSPIVRVRIIENQHSWPVRTPSFQPGGQIYFPFDRSQLVNYKYMSFGIFHHSNGQDGEPLDMYGNPNLRNGDFTTNFFITDFHKGKISDNGNKYLRLGVELHSGLIEKGDQPAYRDRFAKARINYQLGYTKFVRYINRFLYKDAMIDSTHTEEEKYRLILNGMIVVDDINADWNQRFNIELKGYRKIHNSENVAVFASIGYTGHDNYNIYFYQPYPFVRIGLAASNAFMYNNRSKAQRKKVEAFQKKLK